MLVNLKSLRKEMVERIRKRTKIEFLECIFLSLLILPSYFLLWLLLIFLTVNVLHSTARPNDKPDLGEMRAWNHELGKLWHFRIMVMLAVRIHDSVSGVWSKRVAC